MYVVGQSIGRGRRAGLASVLGVHTGTLVHVTAAAVGISSLLVASATAFAIVKYAGAAYLIVLGARRLLGMEEPRETETRGPTDLKQHYRQGIVVNVLNPKTALFFLAFLPQFINPDGSAVSDPGSKHASRYGASGRLRSTLSPDRESVRRQPRLREPVAAATTPRPTKTEPDTQRSIRGNRSLRRTRSAVVG